MSWILNCRWDVFFHDKFYLSRGVSTRKKHLLLSNILIEWNFNSCFTLMVWILKLMRYFRFVGVSLPPVKQRWAFGGAGVALRALCLELHSLGLAVPLVLVDQALPFCAPVLSPCESEGTPCLWHGGEDSGGVWVLPCAGGVHSGNAAKGKMALQGQLQGGTRVSDFHKI